MDYVNHDQKSRDKLVAYIQDAYAMEKAGVEPLERHADQAKGVPVIEAKVWEHLDQTRRHQARMEERLRAHGAQPSAVKGALGALAGAATGAVSGARPDPIAMNTRDEYVNEHLEIASYAMLMATARAFGDEETVNAAALNAQDEVAMQGWLAKHVAEVGLLALQQDGLTIPESAWQFARDGADVASIAGTGKDGYDDEDAADIKAFAQSLTPAQSDQTVSNVDW